MKELIVLIFLLAHPAQAIADCPLVSRQSGAQGRFIYKPLAAHFPTAAIVTPRRLFPFVPRASVLDASGKFLHFARLKSTGNCKGLSECLFAATFLLPHSGGWYRRHVGSIQIKVTPAKKSQGCRIYPINNPAKRAELSGR